MRWKHDHPKPVIGLAGGIGSGKSLVAGMLRDLGCGVIDADKDAHAALNSPEAKSQLTTWWGSGVVKADGTVDRKAVAAIVFNNPEETAKLNGLIHPMVAAARLKKTAEMMGDPSIQAVVLDVPLLFEVEIHRDCDAVIFVESPYEQRVMRVRTTRGWKADELDRREKMQIGLDKKRKMADYIVDNSGEVSAILRQVQRVYSQILSRNPPEK